MNKKLFSRKRLLIAAAVIFAAAALALFIYLRPYPPDAEARNSMTESGAVEEDNWLAFQSGQEEQGPSVIFYPGGLVEEQAYAPLAQGLAEKGFTTYIVKMPVNLAVLAPDRAEKILEENPDKEFVIGGHSLGGSMASRYAAENAQAVQGVFFLASYPDEGGRLDQTDLPVLSITAGRDGVLNQDSYNEAEAYLPDETESADLTGGNHAGFGSYGPQDGDGEAAISSAEQTRRTVEIMEDWLIGQVE
ncbi:alpha/beta fold hydrolase [Sinobaca sp. H24]|uniref:alpha/beta fold hydrolase n=1 Tax=Sinobaca sp. H24 TaxID=2923376 RepID=UPI002079F11E|nr:alpha/beta fold hydrolase [Sinobaca sp. H24]